MSEAPARRDGVTLTWRYTYWSMWIYVASAHAGLIGNLLFLQEPSVAVVLGLLTVACLVVDQRLISGLRAGLGRDTSDRRHRLLMLTPGIALVALGSIDATVPLGFLLAGWTIASLQAAGLPARRRLLWLAQCFVLLVATRAGIGVATGASIEDIASLTSPREIATGLLLAVALPTLVVFQAWLWDLVLRVRDAGETATELATVRERLRFAADLHDIQGHHLQVIALRSELAERLLDHDPQAARSTLHEVQEVARQAMAETRDIVHGYRSVTLHEEALNAASVLEASGAVCSIDVDDRADHPLLATMLREATTNILRHSDARHVDIRLEHTAKTTLRISNDGVGEATRTSGGSGLTTLAERFAAVGGAFDVEQDADHFTLIGTLPPEAAS